MTGSNQKSNRSPKMELSAEDVEDALYELRDIGAVVEIQGDGRKYKYKHLLYEWLGVDKVQLAIMAELLLRGEQTLGELRARAARMEPIDGQHELKPLVQQLIEKNLILPLTPEGRGQMVTHNLYLPEELAKLERIYNSENRGTAQHETASSAIRSSVVADAREPTDVQQQLQQLNDKLQRLADRVALLEQQSSR